MLRLARFVVIVGILTLYVMPFWGNFSGAYWPAFVRDYSGCAAKWVWRTYAGHGGVRPDQYVTYRVVWLATSVVLGGLVPLLVMAALGRRPADVGLGRPNRWGRRMVLVGLAIVLPMSLVFAVERLRIPEPGRRGASAATWRAIDLPIAIGVSVPEHLLLTGVAVALLLPGGRLGKKSKSQNRRVALAKVKTSKENAETSRENAEVPTGRNRGFDVANSERGVDRSLGRDSSPVFSSMAGARCGRRSRIEGGVEEKIGGLAGLRRGVLRWLELGQGVNPEDVWWRRALAWWGLESAGLWAVLGGGFLFGLVHVGARPIEFVTSFPGGALLCYVTYRSGSIWPGWCVHVVQMVLVGGLLLLTGTVRS